MGLKFPQATYCGPKGFGGTHGDPGSYIPEKGKPQPLLDTSNNSGVGPGVEMPQATYSGIPGDPDMAPEVPSGGTFPTGSTDVQDPDSHGTDATPKDIFKGGTGNG